jgi:hypothetical protein
VAHIAGRERKEKLEPDDRDLVASFVANPRIEKVNACLPRNEHDALHLFGSWLSGVIKHGLK